MDAPLTGGVTKLLALAVIFLGGYNLALPVAPDPSIIPFVFKPIQVAHGVYLREAILFLCLSLMLVNGSLDTIRVSGPARRFVVLVLMMAAVGILSAVVNLASLFDVGEALRFCMFAVYVALLIRCGRTWGPTVILRTMLAGILVAGSINLYYTFLIRQDYVGVLPFLLGQNGPGGMLGLAVGLAAWLMLIRKTSFDVTVALATGLVGVFASTVSYSRTSMLMSVAGLGAWAAVISYGCSKHTRRWQGAMLMASVVGISLFVGMTNVGANYRDSLGEILFRKVSGESSAEQSATERAMYIVATAEIVSRHPLGVSYSGFYDAVTATRAYDSGRMTPEDEQSGLDGRSNPHNSVLYYASANGVVGLVLAVWGLVLFLQALRHSLRPHGWGGGAVWFCLACSYVAYAMTLPTLYNTDVIFVPAAVAFGITAGARLAASPRRPVVGRNLAAAPVYRRAMPGLGHR